MYAKIIDEKSKKCIVGEGTDVEFYKSIGMTEMEVEYAWDGGWYVKGFVPEKSKEVKENEVRSVRNRYLEQYVDPYQMVIRWETLSETEQEYLKEYRQYLLDYTNTENWWGQNPDDYQTWLVSHHPVMEE